MSFRKGYTFDDVALVPQFNNVPSRTEPSLESWLTRNRKINIPLVCSNMDNALKVKFLDINNMHFCNQLIYISMFLHLT